MDQVEKGVKEKGNLEAKAKVKVETRRVKLRAVRRHHHIMRYANRAIEKGWKVQGT